MPILLNTRRLIKLMKPTKIPKGKSGRILGAIITIKTINCLYQVTKVKIGGRNGRGGRRREGFRQILTRQRWPDAMRTMKRIRIQLARRV